MDSPGDDHGDRDADCDITHKLRYLAGVVLSTVAGNFCVARDKVDPWLATPLVVDPAQALRKALRDSFEQCDGGAR